MWNSVEYFLGASEYQSTTIERFISGRSNSIANKFTTMMRKDIITKMVIMALLIFDVFLFMEVQSTIAMICGVALVLMVPLVLFESKILKTFNEISMTTSSTKDKLAEMMSFLKRHTFATLTSTASSYLFGYNAAMLLYFFVEYGQLRRIGTIDIFVFPSICLLGIIITTVLNNNTIKYQIKHIELCLSDLNEDILPLLSKNIEKQQKTDYKMNLLIALAVLLAFLVLIAVLKEMGW